MFDLLDLNLKNELIVFTGKLEEKIHDPFGYVSVIQQSFSFSSSKENKDSFCAELTLLDSYTDKYFNTQRNIELEMYKLKADVIIEVDSNYTYSYGENELTDALKEKIRLLAHCTDDNKVKLDLMQWEVVSNKYSFSINTNDYINKCIVYNFNDHISNIIKSKFNINLEYNYPCVVANKVILDAIYRNIPTNKDEVYANINIDDM